MNKESLKEYLSSKYQGWSSFLFNVIYPIFGKDDFEDADEYINKRKSKGTLKRILLFIFLLAITVSIIVGVYMLIK